MNAAEMMVTITCKLPLPGRDVPVYVALPTGEWQPVLTAVARKLDGETVLVIYPDLRVQR